MLKVQIATAFLLHVFLVTNAQLPTKEVSVHDPVLIKQDSIYYIFSTGNGIKVQRSKDLLNWTTEQPVFKQPPTWALNSIPNFKGHIWAPDISYHNKLYYLYYSVSTFGKNSSAIGVATNPTLNPLDKNFKWTDHGKLIASIPGLDHWNAIDPNLIIDTQGTPWLSFGSFWDGIKIVKLDKSLLKLADALPHIATLASRKKRGQSGDNAIEAPFIFKKKNYYYLFASIDYCCKGEKSTYKIIVGRSKKANGPYLDQQGQPLYQGGGTILLEGDQKWHGVGHNAVYHLNERDYLVFHGYDAYDGGKPKLRIETLSWNRGWPEIKK